LVAGASEAPLPFLRLYSLVCIVEIHDGVEEIGKEKKARWITFTPSSFQQALVEAGFVGKIFFQQ
jgi:hypothetical protein